jgi:hypothetical protein
MAIISPADLPAVLKVPSDPMKKYVLTMLGHPTVDVEMTEDQWETILRTSGDFIAGYFPREQRFAWFMTGAMQSTYALPRDAYWVEDVQWDPVTTNAGDIFGAEAYLFNVGGMSSIFSGGQGMLTDLYMLSAYKKFSRKILGTEGHWEVVNEVDGESGQQLIRLYPTPKGAYPVVVVYHPVVTHFRSPQARKVAMDMLLAESKCVLGSARRKLAGLPTPDGGTMQYDGEALAAEGKEEKEKLIELARSLGEPDRIFVW